MAEVQQADPATSDAIERSYGFIPLIQAASAELQVLLIQHASDASWGWPKGHADPGEAPLETAVRELREETGLQVIESTIRKQTYSSAYYNPVSGKQKEVVLYVAQVDISSGVRIQVGEIRDYKVVPLAEASQHLTYQKDRATAADLLQAEST
jgi:bis(5'-nucleosidyl)-tetraphosphatase